MRMVLNEPLPVEIDDLLARRRALGQDIFDEVWNGEYHMNPAPHSLHGLAEMEITAVLRPFARAVGLHPIGQFNLGSSDDYRVPDAGYLRDRPSATWVHTAVIVVEVLSPGDESFAKFDHYAAHGVGEIVVVDPERHTVQIFGRDPDLDRYCDESRSRLLDVDASTIAAEIDWA